jgi:hypothetical protein
VNSAVLQTIGAGLPKVDGKFLRIFSRTADSIELVCHKVDGKDERLLFLAARGRGVQSSKERARNYSNSEPESMEFKSFLLFVRKKLHCHQNLSLSSAYLSLK